MFQTVCHVGKLYGLPDVSVKESKERVKTAIKNSGYEMLSKKIVVNLAPADTKKEGSIFDLPIAIGILEDLGEIHNANLKDIAFIGELSLDGKINKVNGILPMCIEAQKMGLKEIIVPKENSIEAGIVKNINIIPAETLNDVIEHLNKRKEITPIHVHTDNLFKECSKYEFDFCEVKGQENIKRALEVAAAGAHNCLLIGNPGSRENNASKKNTINFTRFKF